MTKNQKRKDSLSRESSFSESLLEKASLFSLFLNFLNRLDFSLLPLKPSGGTTTRDRERAASLALWKMTFLRAKCLAVGAMGARAELESTLSPSHVS